MYGMPVTPSKGRIESKTYLVNVLALVLAGVEQQFHVLQPLVPVNVYVLIGFLLPIANLIVREYTDRAVGTDDPGVSRSNHVVAAVLAVFALLVLVAIFFHWG